ncbi:MAG TPA: SpoIVB peptidase, partial [Firmicutes bacterium]|nr:SpoIVB peptidase [Bacillota bacterium]
LAINGIKVNDINQAARLLNRAGREPQKSILLTILRDEKQKTITVTPLYSDLDGGYRIGLYIRDSAAGVGTLSFYDPATKRYGALGHIIVDADTNKPVNIQDGNIVKAKIINIKTALRGKPGEKTGIFIDQDSFKGNIDQNTPYGIFGQLESFHPTGKAIPMALTTQVETGPAEMLTVIEGETIGSFQVVIERLSPQTKPSDKGFILKVVDEKLLSSTGGIVQGMSGSPIIQHGRIVGAVTHVFINDPTRGYGIFIEWMYQQAVDSGESKQETGRMKQGETGRPNPERTERRQKLAG